MARESDGVVSITLTRSGGSEGAVSVDYRDDVLSKAAAGFDFIDFDGTMEWADGESGDKSFGIQIVPDAYDEGIEPLAMVIGNPVGGVTVGEPRKAVLDIVDDDVQFGTLSFGEPSYTVKEAAGNLVITVERSGGSDGVVSVKYATADKEATAEKDYTAVSGTLTFGDQETSKSITIPIINDNIDESDESFIIRLSDLSGGATAGSYVCWAACCSSCAVRKERPADAEKPGGRFFRPTAERVSPLRRGRLKAVEFLSGGRISTVCREGVLSGGILDVEGT